MTRKNVKAPVSTDIVVWKPKGNVQVFYVRTDVQTYGPTRNGNGALAMAAHLIGRGIKADIVTAYVPDFLVGA